MNSGELYIKVFSHLDRLERCFLFVSSRFVWTHVNTETGLWCETKQRSSWFHSNPVVIHLQWELGCPVATQQPEQKQPWYVLPGNRHPEDCQNGQYGLVPFTYGCLRAVLFDSVKSASLSSQLYERHCFCVWCLGNVFVCPNVDEAFHLLTAPG